MFEVGVVTLDVRQQIFLLSKMFFKKISQGSKNINSKPPHFLVCGHPNLKSTVEEMLVSELTRLRRR